MPNLKKLCALTALACSLWPVAASAQDVLFLSTSENTPPVGGGGPGIMDKAYEAFASAAGGTGNIIDRRGALTNDTLTAADFANVKVVVVQSVYKTITAANSALITNLMATRPDLTFAIFSDGCCQQPSNITPLMNAIGSATGWSLTRTNVGGTIYAPLNSASPYQGDFAAVPTLRGEAYDLINNVPGAYALYLANGATAPATPTTPTSSYGFIVPQKRYANGAGACTIMVSDTSLFFNPGDAQRFPLAAAVLAAQQGACKANTAEPDLVATLATSGPMQPNVPQTFTLTVKNQGLAAGSTDGNVTITLPAGTQVDPATPLPAGCSVAGSALTCQPGALAAGADKTFQFKLVASTIPASLPVAVSGVTGEITTTNNTSTTPIASAPDLVGSLTANGPMQPNVPQVFTMTVTNQGGAPSTDGDATVTLPPGVTVDPATPLPAGCSVAGSTLTCQPGALAPGANKTFQFKLVSSQPATPPLQMAVTGVTGEANTGNNTSTSTIAAAPDLAATLTASGPMQPNVPQVFTLQVTNQGTVASTDGSVTVTLPAGVTVDPATPLPAGCSVAGSALTCQPGALAAGADKTFQFKLLSTLATAPTLQIAVTGVTGELNTANNSASTTIPSAPIGSNVTGVPTLGLPALLSMSLLLPLAARRRKNGAPRNAG